MASSSTTTPSPSHTQKHDPAWAHCQTVRVGDRTQLKCIYCDKKFSGGGIHRIKEHLAGQKGNTTVCPKVLPDVQSHMLQSLLQVSNSRKKPKPSPSSSQSPFLPLSIVHDSDNNINNNCIEDEILQSTTTTITTHHDIAASTATPSGFSLSVSRKRNKEVVRRKDGMNNFSAPCSAAVAPTIYGLDIIAKQAKERAYMAIARFLYDADVGIDAINSAYFQPMIDAIASLGPGLEGPTYHDLRGWVLKNSVEEVKDFVDRCKETWPRTGCSVMTDSRTNKNGKSFIDFLIYCPQGTIFFKSVDATDAIKSVDALYEIFKEVVEEVGVEHIVQIITSKAQVFVDTGKRLTESYPTMFWTPCSFHCIDLMLRDISNLENVSTVISQAKSITKFIYNHAIVLNMMRKHTGGKELLHPIATCSAASFVALQSMIDLKDNLKAMATSQDWMDCSYSKNPSGIAISDLIFSSSFWSSCIGIVRLAKPLLRVLHMIDSDEGRPSMGYVYEGMHRAKEAIKKSLKKKADYIPYLNIIDSRWDKQLSRPLHAAGFFLNPQFFFNVQGDIHNEVMSGVLDCIERLVPDIKVQDKINKELLAYKNASGDFGRNMAIRARHTLLPAEWWSTYGGGCPNLQHLAVRILSQTCTGKGCEQNWSVFEHIHMKRRNQIEHRRLMDLLFVQYNLRLQQRQLLKNKPLDPSSLGQIDIINDWIIKNESSILGDDEDSNWMAVDQPVITRMQLGSAKVEMESFVPGFEDEDTNSENGNEGGDDGDNYNNDDGNGGDGDDNNDKNN